MTKLLDQLDKKPFQAYTIQHGIERVRVQIPLKSASVFEAEFQALQQKSAPMKALLKLVEDCGGQIRKTK